ncbi:NAD(P)-binding domain-containing protein [Aquibium oceanicum]|uniref:NAD(P)-binding domain-containing protein n=1 Tax=Aquibium oceanicum TaxID=1670800 RepID=UPI000ACF17F9|nr:NAD(P)-binding domain-containing protein [Aquibium oceanicum]
MRYDSLTLFTPRQFSALPDWTWRATGNFMRAATSSPTIEAYATRFRLPIQLGRRLIRLSKAGDGGFEAALDDGSRISASEVVVATGAFQVALVPKVAAQFGHEVLQLTTETYRNPNQLPDGPVLVVGDGASGRDIAVEVRQRQPAMLATGKPRKLFPERVLGKSIWWWLNLFGVLRAPRSRGLAESLDNPMRFLTVTGASRAWRSAASGCCHASLKQAAKRPGLPTARRRTSGLLYGLSAIGRHNLARYRRCEGA